MVKTLDDEDLVDAATRELGEETGLLVRYADREGLLYALCRLLESRGLAMPVDDDPVEASQPSDEDLFRIISRGVNGTGSVPGGGDQDRRRRPSRLIR